MTLVTGAELSNEDFFSAGNAKPRGSSFDLTVGTIIDHGGQIVHGPFILEPGHMVQVISAEVFNLSDSVTGHVTYKTALTKRGVWALTVGIVDPGWDGPISTTLLNFSKVPFAIASGDTFLRVSFFEHDSVPAQNLTKAPSVDEYVRDLQKIGGSLFPETFLNTSEIAEKARESVTDWIKNNALLWIAMAAGVLALVQVVAIAAQIGLQIWVRDDLGDLHAKIAVLESRISELRAAPIQGKQEPSASGTTGRPTEPSSAERVAPPHPSPSQEDTSAPTEKQEGPSDPVEKSQ